MLKRKAYRICQWHQHHGQAEGQDLPQPSLCAASNCRLRGGGGSSRSGGWRWPPCCRHWRFCCVAIAAIRCKASRVRCARPSRRDSQVLRCRAEPKSWRLAYSPMFATLQMLCVKIVSFGWRLLQLEVSRPHIVSLATNVD